MFFSVILIFLSFFIKIRTHILSKKYCIQPGKILYSDLNRQAKPLFSKKFRISGKPDYIIKENDKLIPVELKFGKQNKPQKNHIFQLASYCQLIEENFDVFVPYGIIVYNNQKKFRIPFNPHIRFELETTLNEMRKILKSNKVFRNHDDFYRCKNCSMKNYCSFIIS